MLEILYGHPQGRPFAPFAELTSLALDGRDSSNYARGFCSQIRRPRPSSGPFSSPSKAAAIRANSQLGKRVGVDDDKTVMLTIHLRVFADDRFDVDAVVGDQGSALLLGHLEEVGGAQTSEAWVVGGGGDVMAAVSEPFRDLAADLLVEEELHAKAVCSRCQAASASSASAVLRVMRRSISSGKAP